MTWMVYDIVVIVIGIDKGTASMALRVPLFSLAMMLQLLIKGRFLNCLDDNWQMLVIGWTSFISLPLPLIVV